MCKIMEDMKNEAAKRNSIETARVLLAMGKLSYEEIAQSVRLLTVDEVCRAQMLQRQKEVGVPFHTHETVPLLLFIFRLKNTEPLYQ